jgi:hypothetical protein
LSSTSSRRWFRSARERHVGGRAPDPERARDGRHDQRGVRQWSQVDEPDATWEVCGDGPRDRQRQPGLADTAGADEREQRDVIAP